MREHALDDTITFTGRLDRGGIRDVFARSDVYLQPSVKESFGLAALEARAAGLPVVARTQTGTTQFIHDGVQGLLAADDSGLARALVTLGRDRELLASITAHNRGTPAAGRLAARSRRGARGVRACGGPTRVTLR